MSRSFLLVALLAGCAQLAGIDKTSGDGLEPVSLAFTRTSVGSTVVEAPLDLTGQTAFYLVPDGDRVPADQIAIDTWTADIFEPTPVLFTLPDGQLRQWDYPVNTLLGDFAVLEHPGATEVAPDSLFTVNVALDTAYNGEGLQLFTVGSWNIRGLEAPAVGAGAITPPTFAMSSMASITGRPYEKITTADTVAVLRYVAGTNQLNGMAPIPPFDQTGNDMLVGTMAPVAATLPVDLKIDPNGAAQRFSACRPAVPGLGFGWEVRADPAPELVTAGPILHAAGAAQTDTIVQTMYGNPFPWPALLTWSTAASRSFTPAALGLPVTLSAGMFQRENDPAAGLVLDLPVGLPELITLDGNSLSTDGMSIPPPAAPLAVDFITDRQEGDLFTIELFELVPNAGATALELHRVFAASGLAPSFQLPPEVLVAGSTYTLRAGVVAGGFPNVATGDFRTRSLPIAQAFLDSGVFTVTP